MKATARTGITRRISLILGLIASCDLVSECACKKSFLAPFLFSLRPNLKAILRAFRTGFFKAFRVRALDSFILIFVIYLNSPQKKRNFSAVILFGIGHKPIVRNLLRTKYIRITSKCQV